VNGLDGKARVTFAYRDGVDEPVIKVKLLEADLPGRR